MCFASLTKEKTKSNVFRTPLHMYASVWLNLLLFALLTSYLPEERKREHFRFLWVLEGVVFVYFQNLAIVIF